MPDVNYILSLAECWRNDPNKIAELVRRAEAESWPDAEHWKWAWYLGPRLEAYDRKQQLEILSVAIAHIAKQGVQLRVAPGMLWQNAAAASDERRLELLQTLGYELDAWDEHQLELEREKQRAELDRIEAERQAAELRQQEEAARLRAEQDAVVAAREAELARLTADEREARERAEREAAERATVEDLPPPSSESIESLTR